MAREYTRLTIILTSTERSDFEKMLRCGTAKATDLRRANILLLADESNGRQRKKDSEISEVLGVSLQTVHNVKARFLERRVTADSDGDAVSTIKRKKRETPPVPAKITGETEARIIALASGEPPEGRTRWTLRLLSEKAVELQIVDFISHMQVGRLLKKTNLSLT